MVYVILLLLSPILIPIIRWFLQSTKEKAQDIGNEFFRPEKGEYNIRKIHLLDFLIQTKTFKFYIQTKLDNSDRYVMLRHLTESTFNIDTYKSTYIIIPKGLDLVIRSKFRDAYLDSKIKEKDLFPILLYILKNYEVIQYNHYPNDKAIQYTFTYDYNKNQLFIEEYLNKIFDAVKNFNELYYDFNLTAKHYQSECLNLIKQNRWDYNKFSIPKTWQYKYDSKDYNRALDWYYSLD